MNLQEIESSFSRFKICPKCRSTIGFWLALHSDRAHVQCRSCGTKFELFEVYTLDKKGETSSRLKIFRK